MIRPALENSDPDASNGGSNVGVWLLGLISSRLKKPSWLNKMFFALMWTRLAYFYDISLIYHDISAENCDISWYINKYITDVLIYLGKKNDISRDISMVKYYKQIYHAYLRYHISCWYIFIKISWYIIDISVTGYIIQMLSTWYITIFTWYINDISFKCFQIYII